MMAVVGPRGGTVIEGWRHFQLAERRAPPTARARGKTVRVPPSE